MKMYADYIKERESAELIQNDKGFVTYKEDNGYLLICDLYVKPEYRKSNTAKEFVKMVEELSNKPHIFATVDKLANNYKTAVQATIKTGFILVNEKDNIQYFIKEK